MNIRYIFSTWVYCFYNYKSMKLNLLSCDAKRPDKRAISNCILEVSLDIDDATAREYMDILLEGDPVEIEIDDKNSSSAVRALRKLNIDYEIIE